MKNTIIAREIKIHPAMSVHKKVKNFIKEPPTTRKARDVLA